MKLIVSFGNDDNFSFRDNTLCIRVRELKNLKDVINSSELRNNFIEGEQVLLDADYDEDIVNEICAVKDMPYFDDFGSFESIKVSLNRDVSIDNVYEFLKDFPYQVIIDTDNIDLDVVCKLCSGRYLVEPLIKNIYNTECLSASEMKDSLDVVFEFARKLDDRKLSPLEKLLFLYDYLKTRIYKDDENYSNSASLSKVTLGDSIVCLGYANLFSAIANLIDIPSDVKIYGNRNGGHATAISYVNDSKYNFHSVLEFDPTWDSKKNENDVGYVSKYYWFGLSPVFSEKCKKPDRLVPLGMSKSGGKLFRYFYNCTELLKSGESA
ncbi:MAG: transglutaminase-like domain-containing protein, partial [bacterium]|nr:transglutaminase-like domain-containing protein [bacterium]